MNPVEMLKFYVEAGVDEALEETPQNRLIVKFVVPSTSVTPPMPPRTKTTHATPPAVTQACELADNVKTLAELEAAVREFNGCPLKKTANKTVFCRGNPQSKLMLIGEAPGANEDVEGIPFCGQSGPLYERM